MLLAALRACETGPTDLAFAAALDARCATGVGPAADPLRTRVWSEAREDAPVVVGADPVAEPRGGEARLGGRGTQPVRGPSFASPPRDLRWVPPPRRTLRKGG